MYSRFVANESPVCDFVTKTGQVMATGEIPLPQPVIDSLFVLQKKGLMYLDAFPVVASPKNSIFINNLNIFEYF